MKPVSYKMPDYSCLSIGEPTVKCNIIQIDQNTVWIDSQLKKYLFKSRETNFNEMTESVSKVYYYYEYYGKDPRDLFISRNIYTKQEIQMGFNSIPLVDFFVWEGFYHQ